jgi:hypothetical protein
MYDFTLKQLIKVENFEEQAVKVFKLWLWKWFTKLVPTDLRRIIGFCDRLNLKHVVLHTEKFIMENNFNQQRWFASSSRFKRSTENFTEIIRAISSLPHS